VFDTHFSSDTNQETQKMSYGTGTTQCPKCGSVGTYPIRMQQGGQVITCNSCRKNFTAEVHHGQFTGRNR
jgi:hypothetical protein